MLWAQRTIRLCHARRLLGVTYTTAKAPLAKFPLPKKFTHLPEIVDRYDPSGV